MAVGCPAARPRFGPVVPANHSSQLSQPVGSVRSGRSVGPAKGTPTSSRSDVRSPLDLSGDAIGDDFGGDFGSRPLSQPGPCGYRVRLATLAQRQSSAFVKRRSWVRIPWVALDVRLQAAGPGGGAGQGGGPGARRAGRETPARERELATRTGHANWPRKLATQTGYANWLRKLASGNERRLLTPSTADRRVCVLPG